MLKSLFKRLYHRKQNKHSVRLLGNTGLPGYSTLDSRGGKHSTFGKASFGKYDTPFHRQLWFRLIGIIVGLVVILWLIWDVLTSFDIFS